VKSLALSVPPIRGLYEKADRASRENAVLKHQLDEALARDAAQKNVIEKLEAENGTLKQSSESHARIQELQRWHITELPRATALSKLFDRLNSLNSRAGADAVRREMEGGIGDARGIDRNAALRDLMAFIQRKEWDDIPEYRVAARLIESIAAGSSPAPDVAQSLQQLDEALQCLRNLPASHYSHIWMQRKPGTGEKFDGSYSPEGLISVEEKNALAGFLKEVAAPGMRVAEVGCFLGRGSTRTIAEAVRPYGGSVVVVDDFPNFGGFADQRELFEQSATALGFRNLLQVIAGNGHQVAARFPDGYFDLIYVDAGHSFADADADIKSWRSKVRPGGILCGHDCIRRADEFSEEQMQKLSGGDRVSATHMDDPRNPGQIILAHPGVILAVAENFGTEAKVHASPLGVWSYHVPR
jgi:SAM-dependent methyltransferase